MKIRSYGFTLIELIATLAIASILVLISINIYTNQVRKGRRIDAINSLLAISLAEERYRSNNSTYGTFTQAYGSATTSTEGFYNLSVSNVSATSYTIVATAIGAQTNDASNGTSCNSLTLAISNGVITKSPSACWPS